MRRCRRFAVVGPAGIAGEQLETGARVSSIQPSQHVVVEELS